MKMMSGARTIILALWLSGTAHTALCTNAGMDTNAQQANWFRSLMSRNRQALTIIDRTLQCYGLPKALHNLALVESGFNNDALSVADAAGTWQLRPDAATDYGLRTDPGNDERYDLQKSTQAACRQLAWLYDRYRNWSHVIAAYNCGAGCLDKAMIKAGSKNFRDFCTYLPDETLLHVHKFRMACYANGDATDMDEIIPAHSSPVQKSPPGAQGVLISAGYRLAVIAAKLHLSIDSLSALNPNIGQQLNDEGSALLFLPADKIPDFILLQHELLRQSIEATP